MKCAPGHRYPLCFWHFLKSFCFGYFFNGMLRPHTFFGSRDTADKIRGIQPTDFSLGREIKPTRSARQSLFSPSVQCGPVPDPRTKDPGPARRSALRQRTLFIRHRTSTNELRVFPTKPFGQQKFDILHCRVYIPLTCINNIH